MKANSNERQERKNGNGILFPVASFIYAVLQRAANANARDNQAAETDNKIANATKAIAWLTAALVVTSVLSIVVLYSQWRTFEKTDRTLREGERAFVYITGVNFFRFPAGGANAWYIVPEATNNGTTQTVNMTYNLGCNTIVTANVKISFGPKEASGIGGCLFDLAAVWRRHEFARISGMIFYQDVFSRSHVTIFCRNVTIQADPAQARNMGDLSQTTEFCPDVLDCSDKECDQKQG